MKKVLSVLTILLVLMWGVSVYAEGMEADVSADGGAHTSQYQGFKQTHETPSVTKTYNDDSSFSVTGKDFSATGKSNDDSSKTYKNDITIIGGGQKQCSGDGGSLGVATGGWGTSTGVATGTGSVVTGTSVYQQQNPGGVNPQYQSATTSTAITGSATTTKTK